MDNLQYLKPSLQRPQKRRDKRLDEELIECYRHGTRSKQKKAIRINLKETYMSTHPCMKVLSICMEVVQNILMII